MKIGIISDTHSNGYAIRKTCEIFRSKDINIVFHLSDITSVESLKEFKGFNLYFVFGSMDMDRKDLEVTAKEFGFRCLGGEGYVILDEKKIGLIHEIIKEGLKS
jgi:putative phosphoesterase